LPSEKKLGALGASVVQFIDSLRGEIVATSRHLHDHPELSGEEHESAKLLASRAEAHGFRVEHGVAGLPTAFRATKAGGSGVWGLGSEASAPRRVAFLAEYDALPVVGHGCGHNVIGTASTYAAIGLGSVADKLPGEIALFGTPAEETDGGKITMLDAGIFEDTTAALMIHPGIYTEVAYASLACISLVVEFFGKTAHSAAAPWKGINALDAMIQLFVSVDLLKKQLPPETRAPGVILHGGDRANMVPDHTKAQFSLRGRNRAEVQEVMRRVVECAHAAARATGARMEHHIEGNQYDEMRPDAKLAAIFRRAWIGVGGEEPAGDVKPHGSLDIGNLSHHFPCLHPSIRITPDDSIGGHTHDFAAATITPFA
jgi:amidohydrolase